MCYSLWYNAPTTPSAHVECESKSNTGNNNSDWNHLTTIQIIPEQHTGKHEIKELINAAILGTAHVIRKVQNLFHWRNNIQCSTNLNRGQLQYTLETWFVCK